MGGLITGMVQWKSCHPEPAPPSGGKRVTGETCGSSRGRDSSSDSCCHALGIATTTTGICPGEGRKCPREDKTPNNKVVISEIWWEDAVRQVASQGSKLWPLWEWLAPFKSCHSRDNYNGMFSTSPSLSAISDQNLSFLSSANQICTQRGRCIHKARPLLTSSTDGGFALLTDWRWQYPIYSIELKSDILLSQGKKLA